MKLIEIARFTEDVESMADFYMRLLDLEPQVLAGDMAIFEVAGVKLFIHKVYTPAEADLPPEDHLAFAVQDVDATCDALLARGLILETPPRDYWARSAYLRDPDSRLIEITQTLQAQT